jgi:O-methyltransferase
MSMITWLEYAIYGAAAFLLWLGIRFMWLSVRQRVHHPDPWIHAAASGDIPEEVLRYERRVSDKVRVYNMWYQVRRIASERIPGDIAELGVYQGESAWLIHSLAPDRTMHLFDTFAGFSPGDLQHETGEAATYDWHDFADTDAETVRKRLGNSPNIQIHAGYFPDTTRGLESLRFALVNIDADLYAPVKAGLEYFYPRLTPGGVILVHDYTHQWDGLRRAVDGFVSTIPENIIHVPDRHGTIMIIKNKTV